MRIGAIISLAYAFLSCCNVRADSTAQATNNLSVDLGKGVRMEFVLIQPGKFLMGSDNGEANEKPVREVTITKPFYLGKFEVTQEQWQALMGSNPSFVKGTNHPVEMVSWDECQEFLAKLKRKVKNLKPCLPTEAQWEYACRAGSTNEFCCGDDDASVSEHSWCSLNDMGTTHPVGEKKPNAWGLYDMHGNVWEWCADRCDANFASVPAQSSSGGPRTYRIVRGGSWICVPHRCRAAFRLKFLPTDKFTRRGLRVCLEVP